MKVDAAIIGAGPAACSTALELARLGRTAALVVSQRGSPSNSAGECLPPAAAVLLDRLRVPRPDPQHHLPSYGNESAWGQPDIVANDFVFNPYGNGWHLDRKRFDETLRDAAQAAGVPLISGPYDSRWVADCTGRGSAVAVRFGSRLAGDDRLVAFAAMCEATEGDTDSTTLTESVADGWWYTAKLTACRRVVSFQTDGDLGACQIARRRAGFLDLLDRTAHVRTRLSGYSLGAPVPLAAGGRWLSRAYGEGWIAVGDAAQCFDPLSSQGLVHALEGGMRAAFAIHRALDGDYRSLRHYQTLLEIERLRYERTRVRIYGLERRWPQSVFWRRRGGINEAPRRPDHSAAVGEAAAQR